MSNHYSEVCFCCGNAATTIWGRSNNMYSITSKRSTAALGVAKALATKISTSRNDDNRYEYSLCTSCSEDLPFEGKEWSEREEMICNKRIEETRKFYEYRKELLRKYLV